MNQRVLFEKARDSLELALALERVDKVPPSLPLSPLFPVARCPINFIIERALGALGAVGVSDNFRCKKNKTARLSSQ